MGMITKGIGGLFSTFAEETTNEANMNIARQNEGIAMSKATNAGIVGQNAASQKTAEGTARVGHVTQAAAAGGVDVSGSGSVVRAASDSRGQNAYDVQNIRHNAANQVFSNLMQARDQKIKVEQAKRDSVLIPFKNVLGVFSGGEFNIGNTNSNNAGELAGKTGADFSPGGAYEGWT
jgi:hypothetical protein